jgi:hypothetical protein
MSEATAKAKSITYARPIAEIIADLRKPIEARHLKTKPANRQGDMITFIEWHTAVKYLEHYAPGWSYHVKSVGIVGNLVAVIASISIPAAEGVVTREATGCEEVDSTSYGDACSNAEAMALKRAAAKFGLCLYLYEKGTGSSESRSLPANPRPKTLGDLVTPKQLWMIRNMGREIGLDVEAECQKVLKCELEEISKRAASSFIDHLKRIGEEQNIAEENHD